MKLRPYQQEAINAIYNYWEGGGGNGLVILPTGAGKSLVLAELCRSLLDQCPQIRICCVTHVKELIAQNYQELVKIWPTAPAGIYSASLGKRDTRSKILFCGIQSVWNKTALLGGFNLIIVDECHLIPRENNTTYVKFLDALRCENSRLQIIGLTATPYRLSSGLIHRGDGALFDKIIYEANVGDLIEAGYLSRLTSKAGLKTIDMSGVKVARGDFTTASMEEAAMKDGVVACAVSEVIAFGESRRAWLVFSSSVKHAFAVRDEMRLRGITCEAIDGAMDARERDRIIKSYKAGHIRCLTSVNVLSTGFNAPHVDLIALMRGTQSKGLYIQQVGRGFRLSPGKEDCLVLDFAGNVMRHGPVDQMSDEHSFARKKSDADRFDTFGAGNRMAKECPQCREMLALNALSCKACDYAYPKNEGLFDDEPAHSAVADDAAGILSSEMVAPVALNVVNWSFFIHHKLGGIPSLRVEYTTSFEVVREWVAFEHHGFASRKAQEFWLSHGGLLPFPKTCADALERALHELSMPATLSVQQGAGAKFKNIVARTFHKKDSEAA